MNSVSGIGVLDKAVSVLDELEARPLSLAELAQATGLPRATAHRLAVALEVHQLVTRTADGRFTVGARLAGVGFGLSQLARPALEALRDTTGESVQLYVRRGDRRLCVASLESPHGLRTIVAVGASLPLDVGSAGKILRRDPEAARRGWAESLEERERGVASASAPVHDRCGDVVAAVSVSGPLERMTRNPGKRYAKALVEAARSVERLL